MIRKQIVTALRMTLATLVLTGLIYPLALTALAQVLFPREANGSILESGRGPIGSELIGQAFQSPAYFHPRPSAAGAGYDAIASSGSNLGPTSKRLRDRVKEEVESVRRENPQAPGSIPADLVTASGSGLDPHLSPEGAWFQIPRVAAARGLTIDQVEDLVDRHVEGRTLGFLGEPRVNVLLLNLDLDRLFGPPVASAR